MNVVERDSYFHSSHSRAFNYPTTIEIVVDEIKIFDGVVALAVFDYAVVVVDLDAVHFSVLVAADVVLPFLL
jgi:hypothetical protein